MWSDLKNKIPNTAHAVKFTPLGWVTPHDPLDDSTDLGGTPNQYSQFL